MSSRIIQNLCTIMAMTVSINNPPASQNITRRNPGLPIMNPKTPKANIQAISFPSSRSESLMKRAEVSPGLPMDENQPGCMRPVNVSDADHNSTPLLKEVSAIWSWSGVIRHPSELRRLETVTRFA